MKTYSTPMLRATALGVALLISACGGGGGGDDGSSPTNPANPTNPGNENSTVFIPAGDDLPTAFSADYPNPTSALVLNVDYQLTTIPSTGPYINYANGECTDTSANPQAFPGNSVRLLTLNRTKTATTDNCLPEIKVLVKSSDASFTGGSPVANESAGKMRVRGSSTRDAAQKSFRIKTDNKMWFGEDTFQLNKHPYDLTRVRNKLAFDLMRFIPHHQTLRTQFVEINYTDNVATTPAGANTGPTGSLGLFTHIEKMSKSYVQRRNWTLTDANVYKSAQFSFNKDDAFKLEANGSAGTAFQSFMELEVDAGKNYQPLLDMVNALDDDSIAFNEIFNKYFNKNNYLTWLSSVILFGNYDTRNQNFALYQNPDNGKFYFLPWDYDGALDYSRQKDAGRYADWAYGVGNWWDSALHRRFMSEPGNIALLKAAVTEIHTKYLTRQAIQTLLDSYKPTVQTYVIKSPDIDDLPGTTAEWQAEYNRLLTVIDKNYQSFMDSLKNPMPFWLSPITSNGASTGIVNEFRWDWPTQQHPQGHQVTYEVQFLPFNGTGSLQNLNGNSAFDLPANQAAIVTKQVGTSTSVFATDFPATTGQYWVRVLAKDATNGTSTYAFDTTYDTTSGDSWFGVICKDLATNANCTGTE